MGSVRTALGQALAATPASGAAQRITRYEVIPVRVPMHERIHDVFAAAYRKQRIFRDYYDSTLVKLYTDEGLAGVGVALLNVEDSLGSVPRAESICKRLVGRSPWEFLLDDSLGGVLMAVYDLIGQAAGLPVSRLFGTRPKKRIVQTWWSQCLPPDFRIWADANWTLGSVGRAVEMTKRLNSFQQYFAIESPCHRASIDHYRQLKGRVPMTVAEHIPPDPMPFIREGLLGALVVGGPIGKTTMQRALMAEVTGIPLWIEHSIITGVAQVFQAHQTAAFAGIEYAISITHVIQDDLMREPFEMKNGRYEVPTEPGLGVHFDEDAVEEYRRG